MSYIVRPRIQG